MQAFFFSQSKLPHVNGDVAAFVSARVPDHSGDFGPCCTMGVFHEKKLVAGVVYSNYQPIEGTIELSAAADDKRWLTRKNLASMFDMPFKNLGCQMLIARHTSEDKALRRMWGRVGAEEYIIPRLSGKGKPPVALTTLTDDAWFASPFKKAA